MAQGLALALLGASSLAAENLLRLLEAQSLPVGRLLPLDEGSRVGKTLEFKGHHLAIGLLEEADFSEVDIALATMPLSLELQQRIQEQGCTLVAPAACLPTVGIDEGPQLMLAQSLARESLQRGMLVALPNALDSLLASLLAPVEEEFGIKSLSVSWTRSVSHDGRQAVEALAAETAQLLNGLKPKPSLYGERIAFQLLPEDSQRQEASFLQLWRDLWGVHQLVYSLQVQIAPVFFGDVINFFVELETDTQATELEALFKANPKLEMVPDASRLRLDAESGQGNSVIQLARPRQIAGSGHRFASSLVADAQMAGLAENQIECTKTLAKNLFFS